jgi:hypothetical protein
MIQSWQTPMEGATTVLPTTTKTFYKYQWPSINLTSGNLPLLNMWMINSPIDSLPLRSCLKTTTRRWMRSSKYFRFQGSKMKINNSSLKTIMKMKTIRYSLNKTTVQLSNSHILSWPSKEESAFNNIKWSMKIVHLLILKRNPPQPISQLQI